MADRNRKTIKWDFRGLNTVLLPDALPPGKSPMAINVNAAGDSKVQTRHGFDDVFGTGAAYLTDIRTYTALGTDNTPRVIVHDSGGRVYLDDGALKGTVGTGGTGASLIPYRPNQSPQPWMYAGNSTGYSKFSAPTAANVVTAQKVGIAEPQSPPDACPDGFQYREFTALAASWAQGGTAGAASDATRTTDTTTAIFIDPASISPATKIRYTAQVSGIYQAGETLAFTKNTGGTIAAVVEDVFPPINAGTALTVQSILYLNGTTGRCVVVPSPLQVGLTNKQSAGLRRGALIQIGSEVALVLMVTDGPNGQIAIEVSTSTTHAAGETIIGVLGIACSGLTSAVVGQTVAAAQINSAITTGVGTLTETLGTNPFNQAMGSAGTPQIDDLIHASLTVDVPASITEMKILFDVGDGSFTQNVLYYAVNPSTLQSAFTNAQTQLNTQLAQAQQAYQQALAATFPEGQHGLQRFIPIPPPPPSPTIASAGSYQWTELVFPISALTRIGNDQTKTLVNCNAVQILVNCTGNVNLRFGSIWVGGGSAPDVGDAFSVSGAQSPYLYRVRPRSALTGARGNPSPATRYGVNPRRQPVILTLPSASYDTQIDTWDIERFGGNVTSWRLVGSAKSSASTYTDIVFDDAALAGETLDFDNFEPWPTVDVPWQPSLGISGITAITIYGTAIVVRGTSPFPVTSLRWLPGTLLTLNGQLAYTLWNRPVAVAGGILIRIIENAGAPIVTSLAINEPLVANQPLPYLWGPDANGIIFGCGDPLRPGVFYSSKQFSPDATPDNAYDLTSPSEPLLGGEVIDGLALVASSNRWWMLQAAFGTPERWNPVETPAGAGLAAPYAHCTDGKMVYFWGKDGIYAMFPNAPAVSLTDVDLLNLFPHDSTPGADAEYAGFVVRAPDYSRAAHFRLSVINSTLNAHYQDSNGELCMLALDMTNDSSGHPRMAWAVVQTALNLTCSIQPDQPPGTLLSSSSAFPQGYFGNNEGIVYEGTNTLHDAGGDIDAAIATMEVDAGDGRVTKRWLDAALDTLPAAAGGIVITPVSGGTVAGSTDTIPNGARALSISPLGLLLKRFLGVLLTWSDQSNTQSVPTEVYEWSAEFVAQPILIRSWQSVPTSHNLRGYHHIRKIVFAYQSTAAVTLTITAYDGTSPAAITLPSTSGAYQKVEFVPTFNKGLLFTYVGTSAEPWAPILEDCEIWCGAWNRDIAYSTFTDLGGAEA